MTGGGRVVTKGCDIEDEEGCEDGRDLRRIFPRWGIVGKFGESEGICHRDAEAQRREGGPARGWVRFSPARVGAAGSGGLWQVLAGFGGSGMRRHLRHAHPRRLGLWASGAGGGECEHGTRMGGGSRKVSD